MKKKTLLLTMLVALGLASCGVSSGSRREDRLSQKESGQVDEKSEVECRWIVPTGSNMRRRVCKSRFEWEMEKQSAKDFLQRPRAGPQVGQ